MKFRWKIFLVSFLIIIISFGAGGFLLVNSVFSTSLNSKIAADRDNNRYVTSSLFALAGNAMELGYDESRIYHTIKEFEARLPKEGDSKVTIGALIDTSYYSPTSFAKNLGEGDYGYVIHDDGEKKYLQSISCADVYGEPYYIECLSDITSLYAERDRYLGLYRLILLGVALFSSTVLFIFSHYITKPLSSLTRVTKVIAGGDYSRRAQLSKRGQSVEVYELAESFNSMAQHTEDYIEALKEEARRRDDFVANFTHELKTPLTSVIGYADMLRSYELDARKRRECADCIYREGKRLEALSFNLLDMIVLKNTEPKFQSISSEALFEDVERAVSFLLKKYQVFLKLRVKEAQLCVESALVKTLLYNLIDNACKASAPGQTVTVLGVLSEGRYYIAVKDRGRGIPEEDLKKITEPFYMVDKSRSRRLGGAGLGLALCKDIAALHGSELHFDSIVGEGTRVAFSLPSTEKGGDLDEG